MKNSYPLLLFFLLGCGLAAEKHAAEGEVAKIRVATIHPERKTLVRRTEQPGQIEAFEETPLVAKLAGYVRVVRVDIGDEVKGPVLDNEGNVVEEGQPLADLWIPEVEEGWKEKQALVTQAEAEVKQAAAAVKVAQANRTSFEALVGEATAAQERVQARYDRWNSEFTRMTSLAAAGSVSKKVAVEAEDEFRAADAARKEALAHIRSAEAQFGQSEAAIEKAKADAEADAARLKVAEAERDLAAALRKYAVIRAPFSGTVAARNVHTGHFVQPAGGNGTPLFVVVQTETVRIFVDVPEEDAVLIEYGSEAKLRVPSMGGKEFPGLVTRTSWVLNPANRTLRTEIDVENKDGRLRPGMYAYADLKVAERKDALALPKTAIMTQGSQNSVWTVDSAAKIVRTPVSLGIRTGGDVEIVSGLSGQEDVIGVNPAAFREGQEVEIAKPAK